MRKIIWILVKETVSRNVGLTIGEDITQEKANELLNITKTTDDGWLEPNSDGYATLDQYLGDGIEDTDGFTDIQIYLEDDKRSLSKSQKIKK